MTKGSDSRRALGRGLSALLPAKNSGVSNSGANNSTTPTETEQSGLQHLPIDSISPNPVQPRAIFQADRLEELAQSIRSNGVIQPLIVQRTTSGFQLVAGERRWRAAKQAGLTTIPAVIQDFAAERLLELALIENIQREDLNPIEVARALEQLAHDHQLSHEELGQRTGKDRTTITNLIRLLKLPTEIQLLVAEHRLSMGHARALLSIAQEDKQRELAERVAAQGISVRETERLVQSLTSKRSPIEKLQRPASDYDSARDPNVEAAKRELEAALGTRVRVVAQSADRGRIEIDYYSFEELDRIYNLIVNNAGGK